MVHLVVDDSRTVRTFMRRILEDLGVEVVEACNGREALDVLASGVSPDLVFVDWDMPVMDGLKLISLIRSDENLKDIPICVITTEGAKEDRARAMSLGANSTGSAKASGSSKPTRCSCDRSSR